MRDFIALVEHDPGIFTRRIATDLLQKRQTFDVGCLDTSLCDLVEVDYTVQPGSTLVVRLHNVQPGSYSLESLRSLLASVIQAGNVNQGYELVLILERVGDDTIGTLTA